MLILPGCGIVVALLLFYFWRDSRTTWKRAVAWIGGVWAVLSAAAYLVLPYIGQALGNLIDNLFE